MSDSSGRFAAPIGNLRAHAARGTLVNSAFQVGIAALGLIQRTVTAIFLTRAQFGLWAIVLTILVNLTWLKQLGIADKYVQQSEPDQEAAFQKAFSLELLTSIAFFVLCLVALPLYALAYGHPEIIPAGVVCALAVPLTAFEAPAWIPYRRLQYGRQRTLLAVDPVVAFAVTVALGAAGAGYWCFVIGIVSGALAGAVVCTATSAYRLRLRFDRGTLRAYASFSWPLFGAGLSRLAVVQGSLLAVNWTAGLAAIGAIGLATGVAVFADRVDSIVSQTIYPVVCAVADRTEVLFETFVKSNRVALMWAMPFGAGLALFAPDLVHFVLGERWLPAVGLLQAIGITTAFGQVAFNWTIFQRAVDRTRPIFYGSVLDVAAFALVSLPLILLFGVTGYAAAFAVSTAAQIVLRGFYMGRLFSGFRVMRQLVRAVVPTLPGVALVLLARQLESGGRSLGVVVAELAAYVVVAVAATLLIERRLIGEIVGYLLRRNAQQQQQQPLVAAGA